MASASDSNRVGVDLGQQVHDAILKFLVDIGVPRSFAVNVAAGSGALIAVSTAFVSVLFGALFSLAAGLTTLFLEGIDDVRRNNQGILNDVIASAVSDIFGIEVTAADMPSKGKGQDNLNLAQGIGTKLLNAITAQLGGEASKQAGPGEAGARGFLGFGINFAVNEGLLSLIAEIESLGFIKGFKELPESLHRAIGLGRLMRLALQPVIHALVSVPYTRELNQRYTPTQLTVRELLAAFNSDRMQKDELRRQMAQHGYKDDYIDELLLQLSPRLSTHEVDALVRWGDLDEQRGIEVLQQDGVPIGVVRNRLAALHRLEGDRQEHAYADEVLKLAQGRFITPDVFATLITNLHMPDEVKQGFRNRLGVYLDSQSKRLTLKELLYLHEHSLITLADIDKWAEAEGYNEDAHAMLDLWLTQQELDFEATKKQKAARAAAKAAKKQPTPPPPAK